MSFKMTKIISLAMLSLGVGSAANAGFVTIDSDLDPAAGSISVVGNNEFRNILHGLGVNEYTLGGTLGVDQAGSVTYLYYGKEAGYTNVFYTDDFYFSTGATPSLQNYFGNPKYIGTETVGAGALDFAFCAFSGWVPQGCVSNAQNDGLDGNSPRSIAFSYSGDVAWLFWDDSGAGPDDNHDDMIVQAVFKPRAVPEPATLGLFGLGLLGVWAGTRRRAARKI